jgi:hypothetical protein
LARDGTPARLSPILRVMKVPRVRRLWAGLAAGLLLTGVIVVAGHDEGHPVDEVRLLSGTVWFG